MLKFAEFKGPDNREKIVNPNSVNFAIEANDAKYSCSITKISIGETIDVLARGSVQEIKKALEDAANDQGPQFLLNVKDGVETYTPLSKENVDSDLIKALNTVTESMYKQLRDFRSTSLTNAVDVSKAFPGDNVPYIKQKPVIDYITSITTLSKFLCDDLAKLGCIDPYK